MGKRRKLKRNVKASIILVPAKEKTSLSKRRQEIIATHEKLRDARAIRSYWELRMVGTDSFNKMHDEALKAFNEAERNLRALVQQGDDAPAKIADQDAIIQRCEKKSRTLSNHKDIVQLERLMKRANELQRQLEAEGIKPLPHVE